MTVTIAAGSSLVGPGSAGQADHVAMGSFRYAAEQAGKSRQHGGIHLEDDDNQLQRHRHLPHARGWASRALTLEGATMATDASDWEQQRQELDAEPWDWVSSELAPLPLAEGACQRGLGRQRPFRYCGRPEQGVGPETTTLLVSHRPGPNHSGAALLRETVICGG